MIAAFREQGLEVSILVYVGFINMANAPEVIVDDQFTPLPPIPPHIFGTLSKHRAPMHSLTLACKNDILDEYPFFCDLFLSGGVSAMGLFLMANADHFYHFIGPVS